MQEDVITTRLAALLHDGLEENYCRAIELMRRSDELPIETAVRLAKMTTAGDPSFAPSLARYIAENAAEAGTDELLRLLEVLDRTEPDTGRVRMTLTRILSCSEDVHVRSKVTLMLGRSHQNLAWLRKQLRSNDNRVRANALESLSVHSTPECLNVLRTAAEDLNNRVAGNALLALYRLGDRECMETIQSMAFSSSADFRATAAWVMAEAADPCFLDILKKMVASDNGRPRLHAIRALTKLKTSLSSKISDSRETVPKTVEGSRRNLNPTNVS